jgi:hypothetical protein
MRVDTFERDSAMDSSEAFMTDLFFILAVRLIEIRRRRGGRNGGLSRCLKMTLRWTPPWGASLAAWGGTAVKAT